MEDDTEKEKKTQEAEAVIACVADFRNKRLTPYGVLTKSPLKTKRNFRRMPVYGAPRLVFLFTIFLRLSLISFVAVSCFQ